MGETVNASNCNIMNNPWLRFAMLVTAWDDLLPLTDLRSAAGNWPPTCSIACLAAASWALARRMICRILGEAMLLCLVMYWFDYLFAALVFGGMGILVLAGLASDPIETLLMLAGIVVLGVLGCMAKRRKS
jgi:hypothetical protein